MIPTDLTPSLHRASALDMLADLPAESVDAAVFDPPYPTISGGSNDGKGHGRPTGILAKNDGKIFEQNDVHAREYLPRLCRVLKPQAHIYMMTNVLNLFERDVHLDLREAGFQIHNLLPWKKNNVTPSRWYMKNVEYTLFARKGKAFPINNPGSKTALEVFPHPLDWDNPPSPKSHPTEKPINLMLTYVENSTQPGDLVLDPFMGTGATGVACQESGRRFIGVEMDPTYFERACGRLGVEAPSPGVDDLLGPEPGEELTVEELLA